MARVEAGELWRHDEQKDEYIVLYDDVPGLVNGEWVMGVVCWLGPKKKREPGKLCWRPLTGFAAEFSRVKQ